MIELGCIRDMKVAEYDKIYAIVRSMKHKVEGVEQLDILSPSIELLNKYLTAKKKGYWDSAFFALTYLPDFIAQMNSKEARNALNMLYLADKHGKRIALVCYCDDEVMCHRSIVGGLLQGVGCNVVAQHDYSAYYRDFLEYCNQ